MKLTSGKSFKEQYTLEVRRDIFEKKRLLHPQKILIILELYFNNTIQYQLCAADQEQQIIYFQNEMMRHFQREMKKNHLVSFFFTHNGQFIKKDITVKELYEKNADKEDGFLYIKASPLETFGTQQ